MKKHDDDDDDGAPLGAWVLATYHCYWSVSINFVVSIEGKARHDWHPTSDRLSAYRWQSYHAARKFQRSHPSLRGYVILNLTEIENQCAREREIQDEDIRASIEAEQNSLATTQKKGRTR